MAIKPICSLPQFHATIVQSGPCVIEFTAPGSESCEFMSANYVKLAASYPELAFFTVDGQKYPEIAHEAGIVVLPTFAFYDNGEFEDVVVGEDVRNLRQTMSLFSPTPASSPASTVDSIPTPASCTGLMDESVFAFDPSRFIKHMPDEEALESIWA